MKRIQSVALFLAIYGCIPVFIFAQSPYQTSWEKDRYILGSGGIIAAAGYFLDRSIPSLSAAEINQLSSTTVDWFDRSATRRYSKTSATASDVLLGVAAAVPLALLADQSVHNDWRTIALMYLETWSFIGGTTYIVKGTVERFRPYVYNSDVPMDMKLTSDARKSFFSGHTTAAFATAVFLSTVYGDYHPASAWKPYIWTGSLLMASVVGYLRYDAGAHFPTDILVGALVGSAIGFAIPWMHRAEDGNVSIAPGVPHADYGFSIQVRF